MLDWNARNLLENQTIASRLGKLRGHLLGRKYSGQEWADLLGERTGYSVTDVTVYAYEKRDTDNIPGAYLAAVCRAFDVNPVWLLTGEKPVRWTARADAERRLEEAIRVLTEGRD